MLREKTLQVQLLFSVRLQGFLGGPQTDVLTSFRRHRGALARLLAQWWSSLRVRGMRGCDERRKTQCRQQ